VPNIDEFNTHSQEFMRKAIRASATALKYGSNEGADYMREAIEKGSPTGTKWHKKINKERGMDNGRVDSGAMLNAIGSTSIAIANEKISSNFGWVVNKQDYFVMQDSGGYWKTAYGKPSGIGMGLLNTAKDGEGNGTIRLLGAYYHAEQKFTEAMKKAGFRVTDEGGEIF